MSKNKLNDGDIEDNNDHNKNNEGDNKNNEGDMLVFLSKNTNMKFYMS